MAKKLKALIIVAILALIVGVTYSFASWVFTKKQINRNVIKTGCIDLSFSNGTGTLSFQNTIPVTDEAGLEQTGYTFNVRNNCNGEIAYLLNIDLFNVADSTNLTASDIKLSIDNNVPRKLSFYDDTSTNSSDAYGAKTLFAGKLGAKDSDTHKVKMWVDENSTKQNAVFSNRLFTMANPNLTVPEVATDDCFLIDNNGIITMYKTAYCPNKVIVPDTIGGQTVTGIAEGAFKDANVLSIYNSSEGKVDFVILDEKNYDTLEGIITSIVDQDIATNNGIELGRVANYEVFKASLYNNWNLFDTSILSGNHNGEYIDAGSHRLNIPLDLDPSIYYNSQHGFIVSNFDASYNCSSCYYGGNGPTNNAPVHYLESIDLSRCSSLLKLDQLAIAYNSNLTKVEIPNNNNFVFENSCLTNNGLTKTFIPTGTITIESNAFSNNNLSYLELYSKNSLALYSNAFSNNRITDLVVNSTIDVSNASNTDVFSNNPLLPSKVTIGYHSANNISDFVNTN